MNDDSDNFSWGISEDLDAPFSSTDRQNSSGAKSFRSVQTSFTKKGMGWECKSCSMLNELDCDACQLCGGERHLGQVGVDDEVGVDVSQDQAGQDADAVAPARVPLSPSSAMGTSKSSKESNQSKQSETSKRSTLDPPAAVDTTGAVSSNAGVVGGHEKKRHSFSRRSDDKHDKLRRSRRASLNHHGKNAAKKHATKKKHDANTHTTAVPEPAAVAALSSLPGATPLPGEGTAQAIAQLLGLTQDIHLTPTDTSTVDNSKHSRSEASSSANPKSNKTQTTTEKSSNTESNHRHGSKDKDTKRTTFSDNVQDIHNAIKLNKKIQGDKEKVDKTEAIKRGGEGEQLPKQHSHETHGNEDGKKDLRAGATPWMPPSGNVEGSGEPQSTSDFNTKKQDGKRHDKAKKNKNPNQDNNNSRRGKKDGDQQPSSSSSPEDKHHHHSKEVRDKHNKNEKNAGKTSKKLKDHQQQQQQQTGGNLTLQAIQQTKQQSKRPPAKQKDNTVKEDPTSDKPNGDRGKKASTKQNKSSEKSPKPTAKPSLKMTDNSATQEMTTSTESAPASKAPPSVLTPATPPNQPQTTNDPSYAAGRPIVVVHIAEKPTIAQAIAQGLNGGAPAKSVGKSLPVHEFTNPPFPKAPKASKVTHRVSSVAGHVFNVDFPAEYQSWDTVDPAELFYAPLVKKPCKGSVVKHLQDLAKGSDFIVLWMDCDREGENINFEVLDCCMHLMQGSDHFDRVYRAHFSAINPSDITKAYNRLGKPDRCQALSVDARQELDLKVGVAFSRFQTRYFQGRYGDLDSAVLSYGPCQTPTLGFCVQRHLDIETFKPVPYWSLNLGIMKAGSMCRALWDSFRSFNRSKVEEFIAKCKTASPAAVVKVVSIVSKEKKQSRPLPLNTVALLKACSKALGIGPHAALNIAERLYLSGYLSYPRTESTRYPSSFDIKGELCKQANDSRWGQYVTELLRKGANVGKGGLDMGDHPPITPCRHARAGELTGDMARVYDLVARHFIASVSDDAVWKSTTIHLSIGDIGDHGNFTIRGKQLLMPGFLAIVLYKQYGDELEDGRTEDEDEDERVLPEFKEGEEFRLFFPALAKSSKVSVMPVSNSGKWATLEIKEKMTTPPTYLTESELISKMEHNGIGTDASISTHIENILKRNYVELIPGRKLKPSRLGLVLAQGYHLIDDSLVLPKIRSDIEDQCIKIAKGLADRDSVVKRAIDIFFAKFQNFTENITKMDVLFGSSFAQLQDVGKPFTRCGFTRRYLQFIPGPPPRLYNKTTETVFPLPVGGEIKQWTGRNCPVEGCNFELCLYSVGAPPRTFPLCPNCFNNPRPEWGPSPGENSTHNVADASDESQERKIRSLAGKNMIRECPHPDDHPLIAEMTISPDPESDGVLIVDPHLGPKWRFVSTREPTIVYLPKNVNKITILDKTDEVFGCHLMSIEFKTGESPIEGKGKYVSCFANDEVMQGLVRVHHGDEKSKSSSKGNGRGGRERGRGRGRRGRGGRGGRGLR